MRGRRQRVEEIKSHPDNGTRGVASADPEVEETTADTKSEASKGLYAHTHMHITHVKAVVSII